MQSVVLWHDKIQGDRVRFQLEVPFDGFLAVAGLRYNCPAGLADHILDYFANDSRVVSN